MVGVMNFLYHIDWRAVPHKSFALVAILLQFVAIATPPLAHAGYVTGSVTDTADRPIPHVRIKLTGTQTVAYSTTVFTDLNGQFSVDPISFEADSLIVDAFRIGWLTTEQIKEETPEGASLSIRMRPIDDVADQVPASAWLAGSPDDLGYQMTNLHCSNCHQLGARRVREFSKRLGSSGHEMRTEAWFVRAAEDLSGTGNTPDGSDLPTTTQSNALRAGWESVVQFMRWVTMRLGTEQKLRWNLEEGSPFYNALLSPETSLFSPRDMEIIIPYLANNFPTTFDHLYGYDDIDRLGAYGATASTIIEEYALPTFGWTREIAIPPGSSKIWFLETDADRLGSLDPMTGEINWFPVPLAGSQGPHTMNADGAGNVWVALEDSFHIGRLNTQTGEWRLYPPPDGTVFGVTHDFAFDSNRHVRADANGRIWITDLGKNELWGLHTDTGDIERFRMPMISGETSFHSLLYGAAIDTSSNTIWWAQLFGVAGSFNAIEKIPERIIPYARGEGPRRLAIEESGILWVPLFGSSELSKVDTKSGLELARYRIPDRGGSPYGITLDKRRNAIWAATSNSDRIYRFDIESEEWSHYPLPTREAYIRLIEVHPETGDIWTTYSNLPVGERDPAIWGSRHANNMIVRLVPGD